jgi:hypothetical protein
MDDNKSRLGNESQAEAMDENKSRLGTNPRLRLWTTTRAG